MIERVAPTYRSLVPSVLRRAVAAAFAEAPGTRSGSGIRRRLALLANAGAHSARDAFVYDRGFRLLRDEAYSEPLRAAVGAWNPDSLYAEAWDRAVGGDDVRSDLHARILMEGRMPPFASAPLVGKPSPRAGRGEGNGR